MTFGDIREHFETRTGGKINASMLATWIDMAQVEIAMLHGLRQRAWYPPPITLTASHMHPGSTSVDLDDTTPLPTAPDKMVLGNGENYEVVSYANVAAGTVSGIERGVEGDPVVWDIGTPVRTMPLANIEYPLPSNLIEIHEVRDTSNTPNFGYQVSADMGGITFFNNGMFYIAYTASPSPINHTNNGSVPEVHPLFHPYIVQFCLAKYWEDIAEGIPNEENKAVMLMRDFTRGIEKAAKKLNRVPNQQYSIGFKLWS